MKHHLNVIITALIAVLLSGTIICIYNLYITIQFLAAANPLEIIKDHFEQYLTLTDIVSTNNFKYNGPGLLAGRWMASAFTVLYVSLLIYGMAAILRLYNCLRNIEKGIVFYTDQGLELKKAANGIIIFGKCKYLLFCLMGILAFFDISTFFRRLPELLAVYLIGKFILIMSHIAERGEFIKEENDLTV